MPSPDVSTPIRPGRILLRWWAGALALAVAQSGPVHAQEEKSRERPEIQSQRWKEDWSPLADPALRTRPGDRWKYIPFLPGDPQSYMSFGAHLRERFEVDRPRLYGGGRADDENALLQRLQIHADVRFDERWRAFVQLEDARAFGQESIGPADRNPLDLRLGFLDTVQPLTTGSLTLRAGRQDLDVGSERFISNREGPNVRQSFDAFWTDWAGDASAWRFAGFLARPTSHRPEEAFDDRINEDVSFGSLRAERNLVNFGTLSGYYILYRNDEARFANASGKEMRHVFDLRWRGEAGEWDWNAEAMLQSGRIDGSSASGWAAGAEIGRAFPDIAFTPRLGLQADAASGDRRTDDTSLQTFNPLFASGSLFTLANYTGYTNILHLKPSVTLRPQEGLSLMAALGLQWRQTTADAIYAQPMVPIEGTAGTGDRWSGAYAQLRLDHAIREDLRTAVEFVRYEAGRTIRDVGGGDSTYVGFQLTADW